MIYASVPMQVEATAFADGSVKVATRSASVILEPVFDREEAIKLACTILRLAARTVTFDLADADTAHVLDQALKDYANQAEENARREGGSFTRWADLADRMRAQAEAAG